MTTTQTLIGYGFGLFLIALALVLLQRPQPAVGSIIQGFEYTATSTAGSSVYGATVTGSRVLTSRAGSLGSVIITGANTGVFNLYNATTSNVNLRTNQTPTSTILLASFPTNATAGTYTFDMEYGYGLYVDLISGVMPTSTITFR